MSDIFISYSRKDSQQAELLAELLSSAGLTCWIDRQGIDLATSWSREIVQAIDGCKARQLTEVFGQKIKKESEIAPIGGDGMRRGTTLAGKPARPQSDRRAQIVSG